MRWFAAALLFLSACTPGAVTPTTDAPSTTLAPPTTSLPPPPLGSCPPGDLFVAEGRVARLDQDESDTRSLSSITWVANADCETFTFAFTTDEGAPATTPPSVIVDILHNGSILRVDLGLAEAAVIEQLVETGFVRSLYVVRSPQGNLFVDLHLALAAAARIATSSSPARLVIEMEPSLAQLRDAPVTGSQVVVLAPARGDVLPYPIRVTGYSRIVGGAVDVQLRQDGVVVDSADVEATDWESAWGWFETDLAGPPGPVELLVGDIDSGRGVSLNVTGE